MPIVSLPELLPQPVAWAAEHGRWTEGTFTCSGLADPHSTLLISPVFELTAGSIYTFSLSAQFRGLFDYVLAIQRITSPDEPPDIDEEAYSRLYEDVVGQRDLAFAYRPREGGPHRLILRLPGPASLERLRQRPLIRRIKFQNARTTVQTIGAGRVSKAPVAELKRKTAGNGLDTYLPNWTALQRAIHRRCRTSRRFNNLMSAIGMRLGRDELLSLPQYMALCPTGQCNALCDFCSVTVNRTGIIKKRLPYDRLTDFLGPVAHTAKMFGIEGNGEPTLYAYFPELIDSLTRVRTKAYLITNGSRLNATNLPFLLCLDSTNFSLNAATAEMHHRVMKLKNFDEIVAAIRALTAQRGRPTLNDPATPLVSVSFVVTGDNVHEVQDFLHLADKVLGVDVIWIRPLLELGNDLGTVEDFRTIVPFEADIRDMLDSVAEYKADHHCRAEIRIDPSSFRSFRPNPVGSVIVPRGLAGQLLAPRRDRWDLVQPVVEAGWHLSTLKASLPALSGPFLESEAIPVETNRTLELTASARVHGGNVSLLVQDLDHDVLARLDLCDTGGQFRMCSAKVRTEHAQAVILSFVGHGVASTIEVDFQRLRTPAPLASGEFRVPDPRRWEHCVPDLQVKWNDADCVAIRGENGGGPYLIKSYAIACRQNTSIVPGVEVDVREGTLSIGFLSENSADWLATRSFGPGKSTAPLGFFTGANERIHAVVASDPGKPVEGTIRWVTQHPEQALALDAQTRSPDRWRWVASVPDVVVSWRDGRLTLAWNGQGTPYLAQTGAIRCRPGGRLTIPVALRVKLGRLGVGVLDADGRSWIESESFAPGEHRFELTCFVKDNRAVSVVLFAVGGEPAAVEIELAAPHEAEERSAGVAALPPDSQSAESSIGLGAQYPAVEMTPRALSAERDKGDSIPPRVPAVAAERAPGAWRMLGRWIKGDVHYWCQKPWTDLHNFSVDGRMDVCCIATGASQQSYQLGNLNQHAFQEIWNGPTARTFRRTVNSGKPLPPCARCPMLHAYQGALFDPVYTDGLIRVPLQRRVARLTGSAKLARIATDLAGLLLRKLVFSGFQHISRWKAPEGRS